MSEGFWASVVLVVATALATGVVSVLVAWQQNRFAERRAIREREQTVFDRLAANSREHALRLHSALEELHEAGAAAARNLDGAPNDPRTRSLYARARSNYLLISDPDVRAAVADGLTVIVNPSTRRVKLADWREAVATTSFVVAANLRGEALPDEYVLRLRELRAAYATASDGEDHSK